MRMIIIHLSNLREKPCICGRTSGTARVRVNAPLGISEPRIGSIPVAGVRGPGLKSRKVIIRVTGYPLELGSPRPCALIAIDGDYVSDARSGGDGEV